MSGTNNNKTITAIAKKQTCNIIDYFSIISLFLFIENMSPYKKKMREHYKEKKQNQNKTKYHYLNLTT